MLAAKGPTKGKLRALSLQRGPSPDGLGGQLCGPLHIFLRAVGHMHRTEVRWGRLAKVQHSISLSERGVGRTETIVFAGSLNSVKKVQKVPNFFRHLLS